MRCEQPPSPFYNRQIYHLPIYSYCALAGCLGFFEGLHYPAGPFDLPPRWLEYLIDDFDLIGMYQCLAGKTDLAGL